MAVETVHSLSRILWRDLFLLLINIQLVVSVLCAQHTSDDQRRVACSVHFSLNAIPAYGRGSYANCFRGVHGADGSIEETLCVRLKAKKQPQMQFFKHILEREMSHANNRSFREASASQNASANIPCEKLEKRLSCLLHKLKLNNGTKDSWFSNKTVKIIHDAPLLTTKGICSCNQMKQITLT